MEVDVEMYWNYRIFKKSPEYYEVVETYYDKDGTVSGFTDTTKQPLGIVGETAEELIEIYEMILKDLKKSKDDVLANNIFDKKVTRFS